MYTNTPCDYNLEDICDYALKNIDELKFVLNHYDFKFKPFKRNIMTLGYPKSTDTERILTYDHDGIEIKTGKPEWGAEPGKLYFVIKHGKRC